MTCDKCEKEFVFKSGRAAIAFYGACEHKCPTCKEHMGLWVPMLRNRLTPPPELKRYTVAVERIKMW